VVLYTGLVAQDASGMGLRIRVATLDDVPAMRQIMDDAIVQLQRGFISAEQIESSKAVMGIDTQLIEDGTYYVVELDGEIAGCGGWSRRATLYGHDTTAGRDAHLLDPATEPARVRAMYTNPAFTRRGVGRLILETCERAAAAEGFTRLSLVSTLAGLPLYESYGFVETERGQDDQGGAPVPLVHMGKPVDLTHID
jgi:GNAT superfamily N-acetyltransferase